MRLGAERYARSSCYLLCRRGSELAAALLLSEKVGTALAAPHVLVLHAAGLTAGG
jgi:hypothetical protein